MANGVKINFQLEKFLENAVQFFVNLRNSL